ncbi:peptidase, M20/M25/M40 family [Oesophagostomum dentatum]|uniref:Peptidase, M20/M25/M40 family n=1 Tax=Oesophagostomum dentatum TaxID=61180 RepID=A0A0B1TD71_OESDE|nr:peptidase, M20/M25/M40 family [Oesophagostomum dentatum]
MVKKALIDVEKLLLKYMSIDSTTGREGEFAETVKLGLEQGGWTVLKQPLDKDPSRFNLLATRRPLEKFSPRVVFNSHLDTVPPFIPPTEDAEKIYGRGSSDAKGQMACMVSAAQALAESHPEVAEQLGLLFVVGEEFDHVGMQVIVRCKAKGGHSGYPAEGESAIHNLLPVLNDILNYKWPSDDKHAQGVFDYENTGVQSRPSINLGPLDRSIDEDHDGYLHW